MDFREYLRRREEMIAERRGRKGPRPFDPEQGLKAIVEDLPCSGSSSMRNSWKVAVLCTPEFVAGLDSYGRQNLLQWMGLLSEPEAGRAVMRHVLANAGMLTQEATADFVTAPIMHPSLALASVWRRQFIPFTSPEARIQRPKTAAEHFGDVDAAAPSNAIVTRVSAVLHAFRVGKLEHRVSCMREDPSTSDDVCRTPREFRWQVPADVAALVKADSVERLRLMADIRMEPLPVAFMLHEGGPKCRGLLLRPETYEGSEVDMDLLATYAVMCMQCDRAIDLLQSLEDATPGYLRSVKDVAGHNLLWYLAFRKTLRVHSLGDDGGMELRAVRNFLTKKAKCDTKERDAFGLSWMDVRDKLGLCGAGINW